MRILTPLWPTLQEPGYGGEWIPKDALDVCPRCPHDDARLGYGLERANLSMI
jgi:hypothetical protein